MSPDPIQGLQKQPIPDCLLNSEGPDVIPTFILSRIRPTAEFSKKNNRNPNCVKAGTKCDYSLLHQAPPRGFVVVITFVIGPNKMDDKFLMLVKVDVRRSSARPAKALRPESRGVYLIVWN